MSDFVMDFFQTANYGDDMMCHKKQYVTELILSFFLNFRSLAILFMKNFQKPLMVYVHIAFSIL